MFTNKVSRIKMGSAHNINIHHIDNNISPLIHLRDYEANSRVLQMKLHQLNLEYKKGLWTLTNSATQRA